MRSRLHLAAVAAVLLSANALVGTLTATSTRAHAAMATVPRPDHVVIVLEENHSATGIIANPSAPYINSLAAGNANFTQSYAETHPSEPNYLAFFSGSTQGVTDDSCPHSFSTPNLGGELLAANLGFAGYSESLPSAGYTGCASGTYARKHNPWVNFPAIPSAANQPFTAFPTDYSTLPAVSVVIPNLQNDMHDGSVAQGDSWLQTNMSGYVAWAQQHNSLFILSFDEDDNANANRVATVFAGQRVVPGSYPETINHYSVLRTIQNAYGLAPTGASATAAPILDVWAPPANDQPPVASFTSSCPAATCAFDASGSSDPDGSVVSYGWDFGDGGSATGASASHAYVASGSYAVSLTVSDDLGATNVVTHQVSATAPANQPFVSDGFNRTVAGGLGSANVGGVWSTSGTASSFSVAPGAASMRLATAGMQLSGYPGSVARTDADVTMTFGSDRVPTGGPVYFTVNGRRVAANSGYNARLLLTVSGSVTLWLTRMVNGTETTLGAKMTVPGLKYSAGTPIRVRVQVTGTNPAVLRARVWPAAGVEPATWQAGATDSTAALQIKGSVGFTAYLSSAATNAPVTVRLTDLSARPTTGA